MWQNCHITQLICLLCAKMIAGFQSMLMGDDANEDKEVDSLFSQSFADTSTTSVSLDPGSSCRGGRGDRHNQQATTDEDPAKSQTSSVPMSKRLAAHFEPLQACDITHLVDQPWRGAEAYHFLMLSQNQLYAGLHEQALRTALLLRDYDDILQPAKVYSLIGLYFSPFMSAISDQSVDSICWSKPFVALYTILLPFLLRDSSAFNQHGNFESVAVKCTNKEISTLLLSSGTSCLRSENVVCLISPVK